MSEYLEHLPKKRMASGIICIHQDKILVLKTSYKDYWEIPGGVVEQDESPLNAAQREAYEEIGIQINSPLFRTVEYCHPIPERSESLMWIYSYELTDQEVASIQIDQKEIIDYKFLPLSEANKLIVQRMRERIEIGYQNHLSNSATYFQK